MAPYQGDGSPGPMIVDQAGNLVWFHGLPAGDSATNFQVASYEGKPVLTWWQGRILEVGFGQGEDVIYNTSYQQVANVRAGNGYRADLHEIRLTPEGTAWIDIFQPIRTDLSAVHGQADGVLSDSIVQEIDVKTGLVMWEWHALGHVPIGESHNPVPGQGTTYPWDYVHVNSVDPGPSGDVLLSARSTWTLYDVDIRTGAVRWRLGGSHSSFKQGPGTHFYWQHDAEFQAGGEISVFDNGSDPPKEKQSRGLLLRPNLATHTVALARQFTNPTSTLLATSQGNVLSLPGGNWLLGYGGLPNFTEFDSAGEVLLDGTLGRGVQDFRTYLSPWSGQPASSPTLTAAASGGTITVSVSWNGATDVSEWRLLRGRLAGVARTGGRRAEGRVSDHAHRVERRSVRRRGGAELRRGRDRHVLSRSRLSSSGPDYGLRCRARARACSRSCFRRSGLSLRYLRSVRSLRRAAADVGVAGRRQEVVGEAAFLGGAQARGQLAAQLLAVGAVERFAQRFLERARAGAVLELEAPAVGG